MKKLFAILSLVGLMFTFSCEDPNEDIMRDLDNKKSQDQTLDFDAKSGL